MPKTILTVGRIGPVQPDGYRYTDSRIRLLDSRRVRIVPIERRIGSRR